MVFSRYFLAFFVVLLLAFSAKADTYKYAIMAKGDTAGYLVIQQTLQNDTVSYSFESEASITFIKRFDVTNTKQCNYYEDMLVYAESKTVVNGETRDHSSCSWNEKGYTIKSDNDEYLQPEPVYFGAMRLFFQEPSNVSKIYSESKAKYYNIGKVGTNAYRINTGFGKHDTYYYQNGKVIFAEMVTPLIDFQLILVDVMPSKIAAN